ncbi:hypothetical protein JCM10908_000744 [Rhodotorula pacifica]|uniref:uncharacterized protein n=1 Tax=Rhodotorula pacifica TaxID=1495444 RepID=UPI00317C0E89
MDPPTEPCPEGVTAIPLELLDLRPDADIDRELLSKRPVQGEKNIWFFWHQGYERMHPYTQRNVRAWHRRFSKQGWTVRVVDYHDGSPHHVSQYLDLQDPATFPRAFRERTLAGPHALQHTSDLVRWPLLLKYGGVYADVGFMQIGDLDRLWNETVGDPTSPWEVLSYSSGGADGPTELTNYFLGSRRGNSLFLRCHELLLALWAEDGGKTSTEGMHASPLLRGVPPMSAGSDLSFEENGKTCGPAEVSQLLSDYIVQGQAMTLVMGLVDVESDWDGPRYVANHVYAIEYMEGSQLINTYTAWSGEEAFRLLSLPVAGQSSVDRERAREIVEGCLSRSFGFKLAHGLILRVLGPTLGSLWRANDGADITPGTFAYWLRSAMVYWTQAALPPRDPALEVVRKPLRMGRLLEV